MEPLARPFPVRLSVPTTYLPCALDVAPGPLPRNPRCPEPSTAAPPSSVHDVSIDTAEQARGVAGSHRSAIAALLKASESYDFEEAFSLFEAELQNSSSAALLNDFAAAHWVRSQQLDQPVDLVRSLELVRQAVEADESFAPAMFNAGLLCRSLGLSWCEREAWERYLRLDSDPSSPWAQEARQHQARLAWPSLQSLAQAKMGLEEAVTKRDSVRLRHLVASHPGTAEAWALDVLLGKWAAAVEQKQAAHAAALLADARLIADETGATRRNRPLSAAVAAIERAGQTDSEAARLASLVRGHASYARGIQRFTTDYEPAARHFTAARQALAQGGSPFALVAELQRITCLMRNNEYERGLDALRRLEREEGILPPALGGRVYWLRSFAETHQRRLLEAIDSYRQAVALYEQAEDASSLFWAEWRLAELLDLVGQTEVAWQHRYRELARLGSIEDLRGRTWALSEASAAVLGLNAKHSAKLLHTEAVQVGRLAGDDLILAEALRKSADVALASGQPEEAREAVQEASRIASDFGQGNASDAVELKILQIEGRLALPSEPARALAKFEAASALARTLGQTIYLPELHAERAEALGLLHRFAEREEALDAAVLLVEEEWEAALKERSPGDYEALWPTYFGPGRKSFDRLIEALVLEGKLDRALTVAERARAREVLDLLRDPAALQSGLRSFFRGETRPLTVAELIARLPPKTAVVEFALTEDRLFTWVLARDGVRFFHEQPAGPVLAQEIESAIDAIRSSTQQFEIERRLAAPFDRLIRPLDGYLREAEHLVFIPDGALHALPFAALYDRSTRRFLIESHPVAITPSATLYAYALERNRELAAIERRAPKSEPGLLAVCDPAFPAEKFPALSRLSGAAAECTAVAEQYPSSTLLAGETATKRQFLTELSRHSVLHFAGHAIGHPSAAYIVLAADSSDELGILYASDLLSRETGRTRIAVLSACSSVAEQAARGQGVAALVRPLMGAGIPAVVGTLWKVDDQATLHWARSFHHHLLAGDDAARAMQAAQLDLLHAKQLKLQLPQSWAAFQLVGYASFLEENKEE